MRLFGSLSELVQVIFRKNGVQQELEPNQSVTYTADRLIDLPQVDANEVIVGRISADQGANRLKNKDLEDASVAFVDDGDPTKKVKFQVSGVTTATTRTLTVPDASDTLTLLTAAQTLTNKSIDASTNTISNIADANIKVGAGIDAAKLADASVSNAQYEKLSSQGTAGAGNLVTTDGTQTLSNKTFTVTNASTITVKDANFTLQDDGDTTKQAQFQLSGLTTGTTRTYTLPNLSDSLVSRTSTDTGANRLNNKELDDNGVLFVDDADTTKKARFELSSITTGNTRVLTVPDASTTLVGTDTTQTLTNKSISGSSNTITNVSLTTGVTGTLPIGNGGTNGTTATAGFDNLSPLTTKGDTVAYDGTHNVRFAAGANGTVLTADSTQTSGLNWTSALTNPMTTAGDLIIGGTGGSSTRLGAGSANTVLQSNGAAAETWVLIADANVSGSAAIAGTKITSATSTVTGVVTAATQSFGGGKTIVGNADEIQLKVKGNGTQTADIVEVQTSAAAVLTKIKPSGAVVLSPSTAVANDDTLLLSNPVTTAGQSFGINVMAGTNSSDYIVNLRQQNGTTSGKVTGTGAWKITPGTDLANDDTLQVTNAVTTASQSFGVNVSAGTNATDYALKLATQGATEIGRVRGDGTWKIGQVGLTGTHTVNGKISFVGGIVGVTDASSATAGNVGEVMTSSQTTATSFATTSTYTDGGNLSLTAGDWLITVHTLAIQNSATVTQVYHGVGTASGNSGTGLTDGTTASYVTSPTATSSITAGVLGPVHVSISTTTTYYWKIFGVFTVATPQYKGFITAVRIR